MNRRLIFAAAFACAACGLVYELALVTLGTYLVGNTIHQTSVVLSVLVFSMGLGSLAAKRLRRWPVAAFAAIEALLALTGGLSVLALYAAFAWLDLYQPALVAVSMLIGFLIGAEIPVLVTLVHRIRADHPGDVAADLFAADYVGALVGGLAFPFLLLPVFGQIRGVLVVGAVNVAAAGVVGAACGRALPVWQRRAGGALLASVLVILGVTAALTDRFEVTARQALYDDPVVLAERSAYQEIVLTESRPFRGDPDLRLFLNGDLQFSSVDEYRYHEALVHPALAGERRRVLILGGGDGLALREVLRYPDVEHVTLVELDPRVLRLARDDPRLARLNRNALADPRLEVVAADAFAWLRSPRNPADPGGHPRTPADSGGHPRTPGRYDVVIVDFPDPEDTATARLYSVEFYGLLAGEALEPGGRLVLQAGSPYFAPEAFWGIEASVRAAGLATRPYHVDIPSFGDWGFVLAGVGRAPDLGIDPPPGPALRFVDEGVLRAATVFPPDRPRLALAPSTLDRPRILEYERAGWRTY